MISTSVDNGGWRSLAGEGALREVPGEAGAARAATRARTGG
ncbi:hypothetical protein [Streptomyces sp. NBC_01176]|nr:hypothetical protein OG199_34705 [Streptomyces sp. NBC_01176]